MLVSESNDKPNAQGRALFLNMALSECWDFSELQTNLFKTRRVFLNEMTYVNTV